MGVNGLSQPASGITPRARSYLQRCCIIVSIRNRLRPLSTTPGCDDPALNVTVKGPEHNNSALRSSSVSSPTTPSLIPYVSNFIPPYLRPSYVLIFSPIQFFPFMQNHA